MVTPPLSRPDACVSIRGFAGVVGLACTLYSYYSGPYEPFP